VQRKAKAFYRTKFTPPAAVSGQLRNYQYDAQGNRLSVTRNLATQWNTIIGGLVRDDYGLNAANQYVSIAHSPPAVEISGMRAVPGSRVTVNNLPVPMPGLHTNATTNESYQRNGEPGGFMYWLAHDAQASGVLNYWPQVTVKTYNDSVTPPALVDAVSGRAYLHPAQENPVHDADGNLTQDAGWTYQWDGEGRMSGCQMRDVGLPLDVPLLRLAYVYDAQGRRAAKRVFAREINAAGTGREATERLRSDWRYWYDGWNLMVEKDLVSGLVRQYAWGLDLSGSLGGAGGVGGLLGVRVGGKTYTACVETNGNIMGLIDGTTGVLAARWDYEAFGITTTTVEAAGPFGHELCPFRFSSKYRDVETGLYYYGYRYYSPETGRWTNRDPIEEQGGINLYGMVGNDPVNRVDVLGLAPPEVAALLSSKFNELNAHSITKKFGYASAVSKLLNLSYSVETNQQYLDSIGASAGWSITNHNMILPTSGFNQQVALHESVHAYNDLTGTGISGNNRADEGMAYAFSYLITQTDKSLIRLEQMVSNSKKIDFEAAKRAWQAMWEMSSSPSAFGPGQYNVYFGRLGSTPVSFAVDKSDFDNLKKHLGVEFNCKNIAEFLAKQARTNGICIRFSCENRGSYQLSTGSEDPDESNIIFIRDEDQIDSYFK
jgi:RHS repeat-associated protein